MTKEKKKISVWRLFGFLSFKNSSYIGTTNKSSLGLFRYMILSFNSVLVWAHK